MLTVKAILLFLFDQSEKLSARADMLELAVEAVQETLEAATVIRAVNPLMVSSRSPRRARWRRSSPKRTGY